MTAFFIPDTPAGEQADRAYEDLRRYAQLTRWQARPGQTHLLAQLPERGSRLRDACRG